MLSERDQHLVRLLNDLMTEAQSLDLIPPWWGHAEIVEELHDLWWRRVLNRG